MDHKLTTAEAYSIASSWGSYMSSADPGQCFYCFYVGDGRPYDDQHRAECIAWTDRCTAKARGGDKRELRQLKAWFLSCPVRGVA